MNDRPDRPPDADEPLSPADALAQEAVRRLPPVAADPAFRAQLREQFARGSIADAISEPTRASASRAASVPTRRPGLPRVRPALALSAFAAVLLGFVLVVSVLNPGERWRVAATQDATGNVLVDGDPVPASDFASLGDALLPGSEIEWRGEGNLELLSSGQVALVVLSGTVMTLPEAPRRMFARTTRGEVTEGEIRITTGPALRGGGLMIATPEAEVMIHGTTLAVIREPMGTCVCVYEGSVRVKAGEHDMGEVPAGHRQVVFRDGREPERAEIRPIENEKLGTMRETMRPMLERPAGPPTEPVGP
ncbi:MAG: hypothetical protein ACREOU_11860 [Candidatus Eiseniibacteriota bacterium]